MGRMADSRQHWLFVFMIAVLFTCFADMGAASAQPSLTDVINTLKIIDGLSVGSNPPATVGGGKPGIADAIYDLQVIAGLRTETDDPLYSYQWHLLNSGQAAFSESGGTAAEDIRMEQALRDRLEGQGVIVAVLDDGLEIAHEDLAQNVIPNGSYNFVTKTNDPSPDIKTATAKIQEAHGTAVAGIIAAVARNGKGGRGVAPQARLKGFNILKTNSTEDVIKALGGSDLTKDVHIFNMSFGPDDTAYTPLSEIQKIQYTASQTMRGGKGALFVQSAGNGFSGFEINEVIYKCAAETYYLPGVTCQCTASQGEAAAPEVIMVGALNALGKRAGYSTAGSALWVAAPGGEDGKSAPGIITVDQTGAERGYSRTSLTDPANTFQTGTDTTCGGASCNASCSYTSDFCGTSAAAPVVSGAVALILAANPALTRRDVKHILAKTARKVDAEIKPLTTQINSTEYIVVEQGWVQNKAGFNFHNWYGFGAVHVDNAVATARTYAENLGTMQTKEYADTGLTAPLNIPDNSATGLTRTISVPDDLTIETVQVVTTIVHDNVAELGIELTSPSGTKSIVMNIRGGMKTGLTNAVIGSNAFYGEKSKGDWTIKILDSVSQKTGTLQLLKLVIYGH